MGVPLLQVPGIFVDLGDLHFLESIQVTFKNLVEIL